MVKIVGDQFLGKQNIQRSDSNLKKDDIKSIQFAKIVDLLCHGEIEGIKAGNFVDGAFDNYQQNIFLDDTQIQTVNARQNFADVKTDVRIGTSNQEVLSIINAIENTTPVSRNVDRSPLNTTVNGIYLTNNTQSPRDVLNYQSSDSTYRLENNSVELPPKTIVFIYPSTSHLFKVNESINFQNSNLNNTRTIIRITRRGQATKTGDSTSYRYIFLERRDGLKFNTSMGTMITSPFPGQATTSVGVSATTSSLTSSTANFDKLRVTLQFPDLSITTTEGKIQAASVHFGIQIIENDGTTHFPLIHERVRGIALRGYTKDFEIDFSASAIGSFQTASQSNANKFKFKFLTENFTNTFQSGDNVIFIFNDGILQGQKFTASITSVASAFDANGISTTTVQTNLDKSSLNLNDSDLYKNAGTGIGIEFSITIPNQLTSFPLTIKVTRNSFDETNARFRNQIIFQSFTEIKTETRPYNNFALVGLTFNAEQFGKYPTRKYLVQGTKIKIPAADSNGNTPVVVRNQTQATALNLGTLKNFNFIHYPSGYIFNGTLTTTKFFTNDPAWILYDLLTTDKGFGQQIKEDSLDVFSFYEASRYSSTLITLSDSTKEPRFSCNAILNQQKDAYQTIRDFCSAMNAVPFYSVGSLKISQDRPTDPSYIFNLSNVSEAGFVYNSTAQKTKFTQCTVSYFDNNIQDLQVENVFLKNLHTNLANVENAFGLNVKNLKTFGCTSRTQAIRAAKWFLLTQFLEGEIVSFSITVESGVILRPGQVVAIQDPLKMGDRRGGRIVSATTDSNSTVITVDDVDNTNIGTTTGSNVLLSVVLSTANTDYNNRSEVQTAEKYIETKEVTGIDLANKTITTSPFRVNPKNNSVFVLDRQSSNVSVLPKYRIIGIAEDNNAATYSVTAVLYNENIYSLVEDVDNTVEDIPKELIKIPEPPKNLSATESIILQNNRATVLINVAWTPVQGVKEYLLEYQVDGIDNIQRIKTSQISFDIFNAKEGLYSFALRSINALGQQSNETIVFTKTFLGKTAKPAAVQNLTMEIINDENMLLKFDKSTEADVTHGGNVIYHYDSATDGSGTFNPTKTDVFDGNSTQIIVPKLEGKHMLKFRDDGGRDSENATSIIINSNAGSNPDYLFIEETPTAIVKQILEHNTSPKFNGTKTDTSFNSTLDALILDSTTIENGEDSVTAVKTSGSYVFDGILDLKASATVKLEKIFSSIGFLPNTQWDSRIGNVDTFRSWDADTNETFDVNGVLKVQTTNAAPASSAYADSDFNNREFVEVTNTMFTARGFRFVLDIESTNQNQNIKIKELGCTVKIKRRTDSSTSKISTLNNALKTVTFTKAFFSGDSSLSLNNLVPTVEITVYNSSANDILSVTNITNSSFQIEITNGGSRVVREFNYIAVGYG